MSLPSISARGGNLAGVRRIDVVVARVLWLWRRGEETGTVKSF
jgi:hypothetical protein